MSSRRSELAVPAATPGILTTLPWAQHIAEIVEVPCFRDADGRLRHGYRVDPWRRPSR